MRWGIETSFRELKYAIGLTSFHARKPDFIKQEIYARLLLYNYCELITTHVIKQMKNNDKTKQVNFTIAIYICRERRMKKLSFFHTPFLIFFDSLFLSQNNIPPFGEQAGFLRIFSGVLALYSEFFFQIILSCVIKNCGCFIEELLLPVSEKIQLNIVFGCDCI